MLLLPAYLAKLFLSDYPPTPLAGSGRFKVLLSTLLMRNLGRLRCCRGAANVRAPAAAGCGSLLVWLALTSFLSLVILVIVSPSLGSASISYSDYALDEESFRNG